MPLNKEQEPVPGASTQQQTLAAITPTPVVNKSAEFYTNLGTKLGEAAKNLLGDPGAKLNFEAILVNANKMAAPGVDKNLSLAFNQSNLKQGEAVKQTLEDYTALRLAVQAGHTSAKFNLPESIDLLAGLSGLKEEKLAKLTDWKNSRISAIKQAGDAERAPLFAKVEQAKKDAVIDHVTSSIATRYAIEFPKSDKDSVRPLILGEVTKAWDAAYKEVFGS